MERIDKLLVTKGFAGGRDKASELIKSGVITVNGKLCSKPSEKFDDDCVIKVAESDVLKYVSRAGLKLESAIEHYNISLSDLVCVDIGASTGGFTDCMLQNGAKKVFSVDVGHDQLNEKLKNNDRVVNIEGFNAREIDESVTEGKVDFVSVDVSFISLTLILEKVALILKDGGKIAILIKPQFEVGRKNIGKNGIVKDKKAVKEAIDKVINCCIENGLKMSEIIESPIKGGDGNTEYLCVGTKA